MKEQKNSRPASTNRDLRLLFWKTSPLLWELLRSRLIFLAVGLLLVMVSRATGLALPFSTKFLIDTIIGMRQTQWLLPLLLGIFAASLVQGLTSYALAQLFARESIKLVLHLRSRLQEHIGRLPIAFHEANKSGALASRVIADVEGVRNILSIGIVQFLGSIFTAVYGLVYLISINPALTSAAILGIAAYAIIAKKQMKARKPIFTATMEARQNVQARLVESLAGVRVVKAYHAEAQEARVFAEGFKTLATSVSRMVRLTSLVSAVNGLVLGIVSLVITYFATLQILSGQLTVGGFLTFNVFVMYLLGPAMQFAGLTGSLGDALTGLERTQELLDQTPEDANPARRERLDNIQGTVSFEAVSFWYENGQPVLNEITFEALPGTVTALVGPSGAGKSTIINLIAAFYEPTGGVVRVDGVDISTVRLDSYRTQLGVVFQETFLFDGTIRDNVAFAKAGASETEVVEACRMAHVHQFVQKMPKGYDTMVGERGAKLSGGQKQRVSIARAILASPRILILDEATSNLDSESEAAIQEAMANLVQGRTTFVIAHRLSTIHRANQILYIEDGSIKERGTHQALYDARGRYYTLYTRQENPQSGAAFAAAMGNENSVARPLA